MTCSHSLLDVAAVAHTAQRRTSLAALTEAAARAPDVFAVRARCAAAVARRACSGAVAKDLRTFFVRPLRRVCRWD